MSTLPVPIALCPSSRKKIHCLLDQIPFPASSYTQYYQWKKWLNEPISSRTVYHDRGEGSERNGWKTLVWRRYHQIEQWCDELYGEISDHKLAYMVVSYQEFRYFFSWWLYHQYIAR